jgi:hypothetical protein
MGRTPAASRDDSRTGGYEIRIAGRLAPRWSAWFDGLRITHEHDGITVIHCPHIDQAALHGLLRKVRDVGLPLISVTRIDRDEPDVPAPDTAP